MKILRNMDTESVIDLVLPWLVQGHQLDATKVAICQPRRRGGLRRTRVAMCTTKAIARRTDMLDGVAAASKGTRG